MEEHGRITSPSDAPRPLPPCRAEDASLSLLPFTTAFTATTPPGEEDDAEAALERAQKKQRLQQMEAQAKLLETPLQEPTRMPLRMSSPANAASAFGPVYTTAPPRPMPPHGTGYAAAPTHPHETGGRGLHAPPTKEVWDKKLSQAKMQAMMVQQRIKAQQEQQHNSKKRQRKEASAVAVPRAIATVHAVPIPSVPAGAPQSMPHALPMAGPPLPRGHHPQYSQPQHAHRLNPQHGQPKQHRPPFGHAQHGPPPHEHPMHGHGQHANGQHGYPGQPPTHVRAEPMPCGSGPMAALREAPLRSDSPIARAGCCRCSGAPSRGAAFDAPPVAYVTSTTAYAYNMMSSAEPSLGTSTGGRLPPAPAGMAPVQVYAHEQRAMAPHNEPTPHHQQQPQHQQQQHRQQPPPNYQHYQPQQPPPQQQHYPPQQQRCQGQGSHPQSLPAHAAAYPAPAHYSRQLSDGAMSPGPLAQSYEPMHRNGHDGRAPPNLREAPPQHRALHIAQPPRAVERPNEAFAGCCNSCGSGGSDERGLYAQRNDWQPAGASAYPAEALSGASSSSSTGETVSSLVERFIDNRQRRHHTIDAHLDEIVEILSQADPVKFAYWGIEQSTAAGQAIMRELGAEIELTPAQLGALAAHRVAINEERRALASCYELLRQTRASVHTHLGCFSNVLDELRAILSPVQVAKFFVWVEHNPDSVETLTQLMDLAPPPRYPPAEPSADSETEAPPQHAAPFRGLPVAAAAAQHGATGDEAAAAGGSVPRVAGLAAAPARGGAEGVAREVRVGVAGSCPTGAGEGAAAEGGAAESAGRAPEEHSVGSAMEAEAATAPPSRSEGSQPR